MRMGGGWVVDVDLQRLFDTLDHGQLRRFLDQRVRDGVLRRTINKWLKAGVLEGTTVSYPDRGTPQGGVISPLLANLYLHAVVDRWFVAVIQPRLTGRAFLIRYADDEVAVFEREDDAHRFMRVLPKRLGKFGLHLNLDKTHLIAFGKRQAWRMLNARERPGTFDYLGFTHYWGRSRTGKVRLKRKTSKKRLRRALVEINQWLRQERNARKLPDLWQAIARKMRGHFNYFGVTDNSHSVKQFKRGVSRLLFKWLNRRSQRRSFTWVSFRRYEARYPLPRLRRLVPLIPIR